MGYRVSFIQRPPAYRRSFFSVDLVQALRFFAPALAQHATHRRTQLPRLVLVLHGRREERVRCRAEERVGVDLMLPGVHGHPPAQHLHRIGPLAHRLWDKEMRGRGCGAIGAGCELSTSRSWCSILESSLTSRRLNTSCTQLSWQDNEMSPSRLTLTASTQHPRKIGRTE